MKAAKPFQKKYVVLINAIWLKPKEERRKGKKKHCKKNKCQRS